MVFWSFFQLLIYAPHVDPAVPPRVSRGLYQRVESREQKACTAIVFAQWRDVRKHKVFQWFFEVPLWVHTLP